MFKLLFPPTVPNSLPAFDKLAPTFKYYFKTSSANTLDQIEHLQMSIVFMDTNINVLNKNTYPFGFIFKPKSEIHLDEAKGFYYVEIPTELFTKADIPYKIQIRFGATPIPNTGDSAADLAAMNTLLKDYNNMSEWSIVTLVMPITVPLFGIQSFNEFDPEDENQPANRVVSTGNVFTGFYQPEDPSKQETLSSYRYNIYSGDVNADMSTWKPLSTSGELFVGVANRPNMSYSFPFEFSEKTNYILTMTVKTKNLYTETKIYNVYCAAYPILEMFNSIDVDPNEEEGRMDLTIRSRQILLEETDGSTIEYIKDEPGASGEPDLLATHAKIDGAIVDKNNFNLSDKDGVWICQLKAIFPNVFGSLKEVAQNPTIEIYKEPMFSTASGYYTKIKIGAMKVDLAYPTSLNLNPAPIWQYRFIIRKEVCVKSGGKEIVILAQNKVKKLAEVINPKQEYYFYIEENCGSLETHIEKTYLSTNQAI